MNLFIILLSILYCIVYVECGCFNVQLQLIPIDSKSKNATLITDITKAYIKATDGTTLVCNETVAWDNGKATCGNSKINITVTPTQWRIYSAQTLTYLTNTTESNNKIDKRSTNNTITIKALEIDKNTKTTNPENKTKSTTLSLSTISSIKSATSTVNSTKHATITTNEATNTKTTSSKSTTLSSSTSLATIFPTTVSNNTTANITNVKDHNLVWTQLHREYHTSWIPFTEYGNNGLIKISQYNCTATVLSKYKNKHK